MMWGDEAEKYMKGSLEDLIGTSTGEEKGNMPAVIHTYPIKDYSISQYINRYIHT